MAEGMQWVLATARAHCGMWVTDRRKVVLGFHRFQARFFSAYGISRGGLECRCNRVCRLSGAKDLCRPKKSEMQRFFAALRMTPLPIATVKMP